MGFQKEQLEELGSWLWGGKLEICEIGEIDISGVRLRIDFLNLCFDKFDKPF